MFRNAGSECGCLEALVCAGHDRSGRGPEPGFKYAKVIGEKEKAVESVKFEPGAVTHPGMTYRSGFGYRHEVIAVAGGNAAVFTLACLVWAWMSCPKPPCESLIDHYPRRSVVARVFLSANPSVYAPVDQPLAHGGREKEMIQAHPLV